MKFSEILDKPLLSLSEGNILGKIQGCLLNKDKTKLVALDVGEGYVLSKDLQIGESAILIKNSESVSATAPEQTVQSPLSLNLFGSDGLLAGEISDLVFDQKLILTHFVVGEKEYPRALMLSAGNNAVIVCSDESVLRRERRKLSTKRKEEIPCSFGVEKVSSPFSYLIGRRVEEDILNQRGEKIVKKNTIVSNYTLSVCKEYGKLLLLAKKSVQTGR